MKYEGCPADRDKLQDRSHGGQLRGRRKNEANGMSDIEGKAAGDSSERMPATSEF
jgi:hypothetical protein